jgi:hypothetical protein
MDKRDIKIRNTMTRLSLEEFHNGLFTYGVLEGLWVQAKHGKSLVQLRRENERFSWVCLVLGGLSFIVGIASGILHNYEIAITCAMVLVTSLVGLNSAKRDLGR